MLRIPLRFLAPALALIPGCMTLTPLHDQPPIVSPSGVVEYRNPRFENGITWFGWLTVAGATAGGAYAGHESRISLKWEDRPEVRPIGNAVIGGLTGFCTQLLLTYIVGHRDPTVTAEDVDRWAYKLDDELIPIGVVPAKDGKSIASIRAIPGDADMRFVIRDTSDARLFKRIFPASSQTGRALAAGLDSMPRTQLPLIADMFPGESIIEQARVNYVMRSKSIEEAAEAASRFPEYRDSAARRAVGFVTSMYDAKKYLASFPESAHKTAVADRIVDNLDVGAIDRFIETFPEYPRMLKVQQRLLDSARTVTEVVALVERFPDLRTAADTKAAAVSSNVRDYREYLSAFPSGRAVGTMKEKLAEALKRPENLGPKVNSYASELAPVISPDGQTLYMIRAHHGENLGSGDDQDIWVSTMGWNGEWSAAEHPGFPLNSTRANGVQSVTPDGNSLLLNNSYDNSGGFAISNRETDGWSFPVALDIRNYYNLSRYIGGYLANDGRTLLLSIERTDSRGGMDIYVSFLESSGRWSEPRNLGNVVNSTGDDHDPFLASDGVSLYYASAGHAGMGNSDIFVSRRLDASWKKWSKPENLGSTINSDGFESGFILPASGDYAYYTSSNSGSGSEDIFRIGIPEFARPKAVVLVTGRVLDQKSGAPLAATIVYETLSDGKQVGAARSDPTTGEYKITLPAGAAYGFRAESESYLAVSDNLDLTALTRYEEQTKDLLLVPFEVGQSVRLNNLFFDFGKATLRKESFSELTRLAEVMKRNTSMEVEIAGHTDSVGTDERNLELSRQRSAAVTAFLKGKGVAVSRIAVAGYGSTKPLASNATEEGRQRNRRVEFVIVKR